jgi:mannose-1-phosphate guanylyltransferase / mannose-6-phosphate isomerase
MRKIYPLVLCGGMGARLWPMSRVQQPKQFQPTNGKGSLTYFQTTVQRHRGPQFHDPIIVTSHRHIDLVRQQLNDIQCGGTIIGEPTPRNTGPAVLAAALQILPMDPRALLLVLPSDHMIDGDLNSTVLAMADAAARGDIVTLGVAPTYAETGYGYILDGGETQHYAGLHHVARFVEKPNSAVAEALIAAGGAYWASGISLFSAATIVAEFGRLEPATLGAVRAAIAGATRVAQGTILQDFAFRHARSEPTERMIFEKSPLVALAPITVRWNDIGAWAAVYDVNAKTEGGNVTNGDVVAMDTTNSLIRADGRLVVVVGMNDVIVVDTKDALLVTNRAHAQNVKQVTELLKTNGRPEIESHTFHTTPWGGVEDLLSKTGYKLELLTVRPGLTAKINGHGIGTSFLSVVAGEGQFFENSTRPALPIITGTIREIDKDTQVSLTNVLNTDLQAILLSMGHEAKNAAFSYNE